MIIDDWHFEVVAVRCRKVERFGEPYSSIVNITITDGEPHIEGGLSTVKVTKKDNLTMAKYIKSLGYSSYTCSTFKDGKRVLKTKSL